MELEEIQQPDFIVFEHWKHIPYPYVCVPDVVCSHAFVLWE